MKALITGGGGFIGCNLADRLLKEGHRVVIFDDLSRVGSPENIRWLESRHPGKIRLMQEDLRDAHQVAQACQGVDLIFHLAAQVAVTTSVEKPRHDFEVNALGTLNLLEAARAQKPTPAVIFASTNKVYGNLENMPLQELGTRYAFADGRPGVNEKQPLDFHSPYGCSKGAADQYVRDYARIYGLRTVVLRQSCIYGPRQFGVEDQGWVAWFAIAALLNQPITIYGDGKQVRDLLYVSDLIEAFLAAWEKIDVSAGQIYNLGGGADRSISIWREFGPLLEKTVGHSIPVKTAAWRPGDQKIYISDNRKIEQDLGWRPRVGIEEGLLALKDWIRSDLSLFSEQRWKKTSLPASA